MFLFVQPSQVFFWHADKLIESARNPGNWTVLYGGFCGGGGAGRTKKSEDAILSDPQNCYFVMHGEGTQNSGAYR